MAQPPSEKPQHHGNGHRSRSTPVGAEPHPPVSTDASPSQMAMTSQDRPSELSAPSISSESTLGPPFLKSSAPPPDLPRRLFQRGRTTGIALAVAIATLPALGVGGGLYVVANRIFAAQARQSQAFQAEAVAHTFSQLIRDRQREAELLAQHPVLTQPQLWASTPLAEKRALLNRAQTSLNTYDSLAVLDLRGNVLFQSNSAQPLQGNLSDRPSIQQALSTGEVALHAFDAAAEHDLDLELAVPVQRNGATFAILYLRVPGETVAQSLDAYVHAPNQWHLVTNEGTTEPGHPPTSYVPLNWGDWVIGPEAGVRVTQTATTGLPLARFSLYWLLGSLLLTGLLAGLLAALLIDRALRPVRKATQTLQVIRQGDYSARVAITGPDELAELGAAINQVAVTVGQHVQEHAIELEQSRQETDAAWQQTKAAQQRAEQRVTEVRHQQKALQQRIQALLNELESFHQGDWSAQATVLGDDVGQIAASYNRVADRLRRLVEQVQTTVVHVTATLHDVQQTGEDISLVAPQCIQTATVALERIPTITTSLQTLQAHLQEMDKTTQQSHQSFDAAAAILDQAMGETLSFRETLSTAVRQVQQLDGLTQPLLQIVLQLNELAGQTTLAAFNIALATARIEQDSPELVELSDHLRSLAQTSIQATRDMAQRVTQLQNHLHAIAAPLVAQISQAGLPAERIEHAHQTLQQGRAIAAQLTESLTALGTTASLPLQETEAIHRTLQDLTTAIHRVSVQAAQLPGWMEPLMPMIQALETEIEPFQVAPASDSSLSS